MDVKTLGDTVGELKTALSGARVDKISQLDPYTLILRVYGNGKRRCLVISVLKKSPRFHLLFGKIDASWLYSGNMADLLRKYLAGGRIRDIAASDTRVRLSVDSGASYRLVVDFFSLNIGLFDGVGKRMFLLHRKNRMEISDESTIHKETPGNRHNFSSLENNRELSEEFFSERGVMVAKSLLRDVKSEEKKITRLLKKLDVEREEAEQKEQYKKFGDLLKYNMGAVATGEDSVLLEDFSGNKVRVELDPRLDPRENMEAYFSKYKKMKRREVVIENNRKAQQEKLARVAALRRKLEDGSFTVDLSASFSSLLKSEELSMLAKTRPFHRETLFDTVPKRKNSSKERSTEFLQFTSRTGKKILVGRNAAQNDLLTLKKARGNDLWFHAESVHGSHVVLRSEKHSGFLDEDIIDAATLALHFSKMRKQDRGSVQYTHCKHVRKPKNAKPGMVVIHHERSREIRIDQGILKLLLDSGKRH
jgi:predicted ribosome quality control (RQC) complex YloA/Tae2 family protein